MYGSVKLTGHACYTKQGELWGSANQPLGVCKNILGRYRNVRKKNMISDITEELSSKGLLSNFVAARCNWFWLLTITSSFSLNNFWKNNIKYHYLDLFFYDFLWWIFASFRIFEKIVRKNMKNDVLTWFLVGYFFKKKLQKACQLVTKFLALGQCFYQFFAIWTVFYKICRQLMRNLCYIRKEKKKRKHWIPVLVWSQLLKIAILVLVWEIFWGLYQAHTLYWVLLNPKHYNPTYQSGPSIGFHNDFWLVQCRYAQYWNWYKNWYKVGLASNHYKAGTGIRLGITLAHTRPLGSLLPQFIPQWWHQVHKPIYQTNTRFRLQTLYVLDISFQTYNVLISSLLQYVINNRAIFRRFLQFNHILRVICIRYHSKH